MRATLGPDFVPTAHRYQRRGETIVRDAMPRLKPFALAPGALRGRFVLQEYRSLTIAQLAIIAVRSWART